MLIALAKGYIVTYLIYLCISKRIRKTKYQVSFLWGLMILSLAFVAYQIDPKPVWDLVRHFDLIDQIRASRVSFLQFLNPETAAMIGGEEYATQIAFNIIRYTTAAFTDNDYLLIFICVAIDYTIIGYITIDWSMEHHFMDILTIALSFVFMPYFYVVTGIRNALAASIAGLAIYAFLYKKTSFWIYVSLMVISVTIHPAVLLTVPFVFLARFDLGIKGILYVFIISLISPGIARRLLASNFMFLQLIGRKYLSYTADTQYRNARFILYSVLILVFVFVVAYFMTRRKLWKSESYIKAKGLYNFVVLYMVYILTNIGNYDMVLRPAYILGPLAIILSSMVEDKTLWQATNRNTILYQFIRLCLIAICCGICVYANGWFIILFSNAF